MDAFSRQTRRTFLKTTAAGVGSGCVLTHPQIAWPLCGAQKPAPMRYSMCNETFKDWPQSKIFAFLAECGYAATEIAPFTINNSVTRISAKERTALRKEADKAGIRIVGLHWLLAKTEGLHLTSPSETIRADTSRYLCELARFCSDLGGDVMVFGSPKQRNVLPGMRRDRAMKCAAEVLLRAMPTLEKFGVLLALEPLSPRTTNFLTTAAEAVELAEMVDSPNCRLLLDCNAMSTEATPIPQLIRKYRSWLIHFHANDPNRRGPGMGDLDFAPIFEALREIEYRGWVSVEVFDLTPGPERLARESMQYMKRVEASLS